VGVLRIYTSEGWVDLGGEGGGPDATAMRWSGEWNTNLSYEENDVVSHNGSLWIAPAPLTDLSADPGAPPDIISINLGLIGVTNVERYSGPFDTVGGSTTTGNQRFFDLATGGTVTFVGGVWAGWAGDGTFVHTNFSGPKTLVAGRHIFGVSSGVSATITLSDGATFAPLSPQWEVLHKGPAIYRKSIPEQITVPAGTAQIIDTVNFRLDKATLVNLFARFDSQDPPSTHDNHIYLDGTALATTGNNTSAFVGYSLGFGSGGSPSLLGSAGATDIGMGVSRVLAAGAHVFQLRTTRGSSGGALQNRILIAAPYNAPVIDV
jgi:hypothetical protein